MDEHDRDVCGKLEDMQGEVASLKAQINGMEQAARKEAEYHEEWAGKVETLLENFQESDIRRTQTTNMFWNAINAILKAFLDKGLIEDADIILAGRQMMDDARANLQRAREGAKDFIPTPIDKIQGLLHAAKSTGREKN